MTQNKFDSHANCDSDAFISALSLAANGVAIVTTDGDAGKAGLTVSSMVSVCAEPPLMLACVNTNHEFCVKVESNRSFALNLLAADQQPISNVFAGFRNNADTEFIDRFLTGEWTTSTSGSPILSDAMVSLDCAFVEGRTHGTHTIYIGRVLEVASRDASPLVYTRRNYAALDV